MALEDQIAALATATTELTDQALVTLGESAANANRAELARDFSTSEANRALAERQQIGAELAQVQTLAAQVAADKAGVTATLVGSEDYIIPAVTQLLTTYTNVVATAISDDIWSEHSHKWGAPKQVLAVAQLDKVTLVDLTKPTFPVWKTMARNSFFWDSTDAVTLAFVADTLVIGPKALDQSWSGNGICVYPFGHSTAYMITNNSGGGKIKGTVENWQDLANPIFFSNDVRFLSLGSVYPSYSINSIATRIADHAPRHPVSGLPMPTIAVATDGGVSELVPTDDGKWSVKSWPCADAIKSVSYTKDARLLSTVAAWGAVHDVYSVAVGTTITRDVGGAYRYGGSAGTVIAGQLAISDGGGDKFTSGAVIRKNGSLSGTSLLTAIKENPSSKADGMVAFANTGYSTPYLVGDTQGAWLCGSEEGVVSDSELVTNGDFSNGLTGWGGARGVETLDVTSGVLRVTSTTSSAAFGASAQVVGLVVGATYLLSAAKLGTDVSQSYLRVSIQADIRSNLAYNSGNGFFTEATFVATAPTMYVGVVGVPTAIGQYIEIDNISIKRVAPDYSGRNNHAIIHGSLTRTKPVGSDIAVWSGFSDAGTKAPLNYLDTSLALGDAVVCTMLVKNGGSASYDIALHIIDGWDGTTSDSFNTYARLQNDASGALRLMTNLAIYTAPVVATEFIAVTAIVAKTKVSYHVNGQLIGSMNGSVTLPATPVRVLIGTGLDASGSANWTGQISGLSITKTIPSDDQIREMHRDMLNKLSKPSVLSGNVKALAYDPIRKQDWVACYSKKLHRLDGTCIVETVTVDTSIGTISSLTVNDGLITVGGSGGTWIKQPSKNLRDPQIRAGKSVRAFELGEGDGTKVDFYLPRGWKPERAYVDGIKKRKGAQDDWTAQFDGYKWFVRFAVAPGAVDVDVDAVEV